MPTVLKDIKALRRSTDKCTGSVIEYVERKLFNEAATSVCMCIVSYMLPQRVEGSKGHRKEKEETGVKKGA